MPESTKVAGKCDGSVDECTFKVTKTGGTATGKGIAGLTKAVKVVASGKAEPAAIPGILGKCEKLKVHDDGDLTVRCNGITYVVTTEGQAFRQVALKEKLEAPIKLLTQELISKLPPLYSQENVKDPIVQAKFFHPLSSWTWYAIEYDPDDRLFFGWSPEDNEMGYADYEELAKVRVRGLGIERDTSFKPKPLSQVKKEEGVGLDDVELDDRRKPKKVERIDGKVVKHYRDYKGMHKGSVRVKTMPGGALVYLGCPTSETWHPSSNSCSHQVVIKTVTPVVHASEEVPDDVRYAIEHPVEVKA